jgi:hypothetical protein
MAISTKEALERLISRWAQHMIDHPTSTLRLKDITTAENVEAVRTLDLLAEYSLEQRVRDLEMLHAWMSTGVRRLYNERPRNRSESRVLFRGASVGFRSSTSPLANIDHELGELGRITRAFADMVRHCQAGERA